MSWQRPQLCPTLALAANRLACSIQAVKIFRRPLGAIRQLRTLCYLGGRDVLARPVNH